MAKSEEEKKVEIARCKTLAKDVFGELEHILTNWGTKQVEGINLQGKENEHVEYILDDEYRTQRGEGPVTLRTIIELYKLMRNHDEKIKAYTPMTADFDSLNRSLNAYEEHELDIRALEEQLYRLEQESISIIEELGRAEFGNEQYSTPKEEPKSSDNNGEDNVPF